MDFQELKYKGKTYTEYNQIIKILKSEGFYWLIDSETDGAILEIENGTIIWRSLANIRSARENSTKRSQTKL